MVDPPAPAIASDPGLRGTRRPVSAWPGRSGAITSRTFRRNAGGSRPMTDKNQPKAELLLNGDPYKANVRCDRSRSPRVHWERRLLICVLMIETCFVLPKLAQGQFLSVFDSIFSSIQNDIGSSLSQINQIMQQTQKLYQTTLAPLAALNQARGFVANSINSFRGQMNQIFNTSYTSAVTPGPQQFESILHSRLSSNIPELHTRFFSNCGTV